MTRAELPNVATATAADIVDWCDAVGQEQQDHGLDTRYAREAGALSSFVQMLCDHRDRQVAQLRRLKQQQEEA